MKKQKINSNFKEIRLWNKQNKKMNKHSQRSKKEFKFKKKLWKVEKLIKWEWRRWNLDFNKFKKFKSKLKIHF